MAQRRKKPSAEDTLRRAMALDRRSKEAQAIPLYQEAIRLGLGRASLRRAMIFLGSSLTTVGKFAEAVGQLQTAMKRFPNDPLVELFLGLAYCAEGRGLDAAGVLANTLLRESNNSDVVSFRRWMQRRYAKFTSGRSQQLRRRRVGLSRRGGLGS